MTQSFEGLGVSRLVVETLSRQGINHPFAVQSLVLPDALPGLDIMAASPTGSGKTLAFALPVIERTAGASGRPAALVLVPTRELAAQVVDEMSVPAEARQLRVAAVYGGRPIAAQAQRARDAAVVVATPGRLQDLLDRRLVALGGVRVLVLDEADRMLDMGFRPQVERILRDVPENRQTLLFSATLDGAVADLARRYTTNPVVVRAPSPEGAAQGRIDHEFVPVTVDTKIETLAGRLNGTGGLTLVFVRTKHGADRLARRLQRQHDLDVAVLHGNMSQNQRSRALARFGDGAVSTLVATDVAARGLDVDDVVQVINFDPPASEDDYVHRVGRTGRAGRNGSGVTFVLPEQRSDVAVLARRLGHDDALSRSGLALAPPRGGGRSRRRNRRRS